MANFARVVLLAWVTKWSGVLSRRVNGKCTLRQVYTIEDFEAKLDQPPRLVKARHFLKMNLEDFLEKGNFSRNSRF